MKETTTFNIKLDKKMKIERLALEASFQIGRTVKWTELMNVLIDEFAKEAKESLIQQEKERNNV